MQHTSAPLDYTALTQPSTAADRIAAADAGINTHYKEFYLPLAFGGGAVVALASLFMLGTSLESALTSLMVAIVPALLVLHARHTANKLAKLHRFARMNNLQALGRIPNPGYSGIIFNEGHTRTLDNGLVLPDNTTLGNYTYIKGRGKQKRAYQWGFVQIKLSRRLPHMVLDSRHNNWLGRFSNLPESFSHDQKLSLEGDFDKHFTLYAPAEYKSDALYVFTPDVIAMLIDHGKDFDIEIIDDTLLIYSAKVFDLTSPEHLQTLVSRVDAFAHQLRKQSANYADDAMGDRAINIVAQPGARLKTKLHPAAIVSFVMMVIYLILMILDIF